MNTVRERERGEEGEIESNLRPSTLVHSAGSMTRTFSGARSEHSVAQLPQLTQY